MQRHILNQQKKGIINLSLNTNIDNELYAKLRSITTNHANHGLLVKFKESLDIIKFPLTCPLKKHRFKNIKNSKNSNIKYKCKENKGDFQCTKTKGIFIKKTTPRTPSNCDKILFALINLTICKEDLYLPKYPDNSDHRVISLSGIFRLNK